MPSKSKQQKAAATKASTVEETPVTATPGAKTAIAERVDSQVTAVLGSGGGSAPPDSRWFFQKLLPMGYGGREAPTVAPVTPVLTESAKETPGAAPKAVEPTPVVATSEADTGVADDGDDADEGDGAEGEDAGGDGAVTAGPKNAKSAKKAAARRRKAEAQRAKQAVLLAQLKATAVAELETLRTSEDWTARTARIKAIHPLPADQERVGALMSLNGLKALKTDAAAATTLTEIKVVLPKIQALEAAVKSLASKSHFAAAHAALEAAPPLPVTAVIPDAVDGDEHADPSINAEHQKHVLHGNSSGGKHLGGYATGAAAKHPDQKSASAGKSLFPPAWTEENVLDALREAASQTFTTRVAQPKENDKQQQRYKHPAWAVTLRRVTVNVVVITEDKGSGYEVITGYPS